ncbi:hypothetical protein E3O42_11805 [Cryobacterium adonitolivorans]|uniref:Amine oxidase domain-containing protein n=1 Tax=Cryobacterium adonitolivorans TaxID=1259189 RepID=A0A4R8W7G7_9MICO|nr:hypothetical protein E3O42_11805 [Cryobacterium adonitolivorans]
MRPEPRAQGFRFSPRDGSCSAELGPDAGGGSHRAAAVIIAVPLGVLKGRAIRFEPTLPPLLACP